MPPNYAAQNSLPLGLLVIGRVRLAADGDSANEAFEEPRATELL